METNATPKPMIITDMKPSKRVALYKKKVEEEEEELRPNSEGELAKPVFITKDTYIDEDGGSTTYS